MCQKCFLEVVSGAQKLEDTVPLFIGLGFDPSAMKDADHDASRHRRSVALERSPTCILNSASEISLMACGHLQVVTVRRIIVNTVSGYWVGIPFKCYQRRSPRNVVTGVMNEVRQCACAEFFGV